MKFITKTANAVTTKRIKLFWGQRSAGRHLVGPVYFRTEWHSHPKYTPVRYFNLTVGNPRVHAKWAFSLYIYFTGV